MQIEQVAINDLIPYENNPRANDGAVEAVANSIREFGFRSPIILDKDGVIIAGHTRAKAAKRLGLDTVPVIRAEDLTPEQVKAFRLADNKVGEIAGWLPELLEAELAELENIDMSQFGFDIEEPEEEPEIIEDEPPEDAPNMTKVGQIWQLGRHRLMVGDSTKADDMQRLTEGGGGRPSPDGSAVQRRHRRNRQTGKQEQREGNPQRQNERVAVYPVVNKRDAERQQSHEAGRSFLYILCRIASHRIRSGIAEHKRFFDTFNSDLGKRSFCFGTQYRLSMAA